MAATGALLLPLAAVLAPQIAKAAAGYSHVFVPSTTFGKDLAPRVAALLGVEANDHLKTTHYAAPAKRSKGVMVKDAAELVAALKQKGLL